MESITFPRSSPTGTWYPSVSYCSPTEEIGCYGLRTPTNHGQHDPPVIFFNDRTFLPKLSNVWRDVRDVSIAVAEEELHGINNAAADNWRPLHPLYQWISTAEANGIYTPRPQVICSGTVLRTLLGLPTLFPSNNPNPAANYYLQEDARKFVACNDRGIIYLAHKNSGPGDSNEDGFILRRRKFERLVTTLSDGTPWAVLQEGTADAFFTVLERTIGDTHIVYSHKVDCKLPAANNVPAPDRYVKLRFRKVSPNGSNSSVCWKESHNSKLNWIETFVQGAAQMIAGHASRDILHRCELLTASDLPEESQCPNSKDHYFHWNKEQNVRFLSIFFQLLRSRVQHEYTSAVYEFFSDCADNDVLKLNVMEWAATSDEFLRNNIILSWEN